MRPDMRPNVRETIFFKILKLRAFNLGKTTRDGHL